MTTKYKADCITPLLVYVLKLENDCWYVGKTEKSIAINRGHKQVSTSGWTRLNKPLAMLAVYKFGDMDLVKNLTIKLMAKYGYDKVRGAYGSWANLVLNKEPKPVTEYKLTHNADETNDIDRLF